jgi:hypothetical protein
MASDTESCDFVFEEENDSRVYAIDPESAPSLTSVADSLDLGNPPVTIELLHSVPSEVPSKAQSWVWEYMGKYMFKPLLNFRTCLTHLISLPR